jgi:hypothetical protein
MGHASPHYDVRWSEVYGAHGEDIWEERCDRLTTAMRIALQYLSQQGDPVLSLRLFHRASVRLCRDSAAVKSLIARSAPRA